MRISPYTLGVIARMNHKPRRPYECNRLTALLKELVVIKPYAQWLRGWDDTDSEYSIIEDAMKKVEK